MRLIDADLFRKEILEELENDVNMYNSHTEKEIRDDKFRFVAQCIDEQPTVKPFIKIKTYGNFAGFKKDQLILIIKSLEQNIQSMQVMLENQYNLLIQKEKGM